MVIYVLKYFIIGITICNFMLHILSWVYYNNRIIFNYIIQLILMIIYVINFSIQIIYSV